MELLTTPTKTRLENLLDLQASEGWADFTKELTVRHERAINGACDLTKKGKQRAACAGVASELGQLLRHVPGLIKDLEKKLEKEKGAKAPIRPV